MLQLKTVSSLEKILPRAEIRLPESGGVKLHRESYAFQVCISSDVPVLRCRFSVKSKLPVQVMAERYTTSFFTYTQSHDDYIIDENASVFPDALIPYESEEFSLGAGVNHSFWVKIPADASIPSGSYELTLTAENLQVQEDREERTYVITVLDGPLAENDLMITRWIHCDCIAEACGIPVFSEPFYQAFRNYIRAAVESGQTMAYIPMFTPPLDTQVGGERMTVQSVDVEETGEGYRFGFQKFDRLIDICREEGIRYFELSHLFTQWGAEACPKIMVTAPDGTLNRRFGWEVKAESEDYAGFLRSFLPALTAHLKELGISDNTYLHISDEPGEKHVERYVKLYQMVKEFSGGIRMMDALSKYRFVEKGAPDLPAVIEGAEAEFVKNNVPFLLYYCCAPDHHNYPNIFLNMPLLRVRILGVMLYLLQAKGFLHWGFNFYHSALSLHMVDPYSSCDGLETFPAGDPFVVYPDGKLGVYSSVRQEIFAAGIQDYRLCRTCEQLCGREKTLEIIHRYGIFDLSQYSKCERDYEMMRRDLIELISENSK